MINRLDKAFEQYVGETLGLDVAVRSWPESRSIPFYLQERFSLHQTKIMGAEVLLAMEQEGYKATPASVRKDMDQLESRSGLPCVYVAEALASYARKRLIEQCVSFVVPGNQMFLAPLGIDLREHYRSLKKEPDAFGPATQAALIYFLLRPDSVRHTPSELAAELDYSPMTMTRAFDEIEAAGLGEAGRDGRSRWLRFGEERRQVWEKAQPFLRSPVKNVYALDSIALIPDGCFVAGESALAKSSMISEPRRSIYAIGPVQWQAMRKGVDVHELSEAEGEALLQTWKYDPRLLSEHDYVDPLSLYLSLHDVEDERVQTALEDMLERVW